MKGFADPFDLRKLDLKALKKEYSKERSKMAKRGKRVEEAGFDTNFTRWIDSQGGKIPTVKDLTLGTEEQTKNAIIYYMSELKVFELDPQTKVKELKAQRKADIEAMCEHGYDISEADYNDFIGYMEWMRATGLDMQLYSETGVKKYKNEEGEYQKPERTKDEINLVMEYFEKWKANGGYLNEQEREELSKGGGSGL